MTLAAEPPSGPAATVAADLAYCQDLTFRRGANFSVGFRFLPRRKRQAVFAAYAFCRFTDDLADEEGVGSASDRSAALDAWEQELERTYAGAPGHAISRALADVLRDFPIPQSAFAALVAGCRRDLVQRRYADFAELTLYCEEVAVSISDISLAIFGPTHELAHRHGRDLAMGLQLTNVLRDVAEDLERDRVYLPLDELERFGVDLEALRRGVRAPGVRELLAFQAERARRYFRAAAPLVSEIAADARVPVALMGSVYAAVLGEIVARGYDVWPERVSLSAGQKTALIARALLNPRILADPEPYR